MCAMPETGRSGDPRALDAHPHPIWRGVIEVAAVIGVLAVGFGLAGGVPI